MDDRRTKRGLRSRAAERSEDEKTVRPGTGPASGGGGIFKSAAVAVLRQHRKLMTTGDITRLAVEMGLLKCQGKTPEATMASALYTDVKRKLHKSLFTRPQEGLFGLREWLEEGYYPEGWVGPSDGLGLAPFKRRNNTSGHQAGASAPASASKSGRQGVRTGPGRSSKSRASRSWRTTSSDAEDEDIIEDDDDEVLLTSRSHLGASSAAAHAEGSAAAPAHHGDDEDGDEAMGEGEEADAEEEAEAGEEAAADEGQDEHGGDRRGNNEEAPGTTAAADEGHLAKETGSFRGPPAPSPGPGAVRRGGRIRSGGGAAGAGAAEAGVPQDECLSPLHILGDAAASESQGDMATEQHGTPPPAKRKRPSSITVPDRSGGLGTVEGVTPKSPYEDSLAALHEIATSPSTFELTSQQRDRVATSDGAAGGKVGRTRPRLHVDVPSHGTDLVSGPGSRRDGGTPGTALLTDNPMLQGETTPAILLQASPVTTANGQQAMMLRQAPVLVTLPPALASPTAASAGQLDTPALLHVQLPGGAPSELMQTTLITPTGQQLTPFRSNLGGAGQAGRGGLKVDAGPASARPVGRRVSFSGQVGILGPPSAPSAPLRQAQGPVVGTGCMAAGSGAPGAGSSGAALGSQTWPPRLTPAQVEHELAEITRVQAVVERLESKLGNTHPQVGKAWLSLSRMYQHLAEAQQNNGESCAVSKTKSVEALRRARAVCRAVAESCGAMLQCESAFDYLIACNSESERTAEPPPEPPVNSSDRSRPAAGDGAERPSAAGNELVEQQDLVPTAQTATPGNVRVSGGGSCAEGHLGPASEEQQRQAEGTVSAAQLQQSGGLQQTVAPQG